MSPAWDESTTTWNNRPAAVGPVVGQIQAKTKPKTDYTVQLCTCVAADLVSPTGLNLQITGQNADSFWIWSRSANYGNSLRLELKQVDPTKR